MTLKRSYDSPLGKLLLAAREEKLVGLWMEGQKYFPTRQGDWVDAPHSPVLQQAAEWLDRYFAGQRPLPGELPLAPEGSDFRREVWHILCGIPYGQCVTYGQIAARIADQRGLASLSAQAVGGAVGHNPISIIIPCHRVIGADGSLTGYAGGLEKKKRLLLLEGVDPDRW